MTVIHSVIAGTGSALPKHVMTNEEISGIVETSDEWIRERTGIRARHIAGEGETTRSLAVAAARAALASAHMTPADIARCIDEVGIGFMFAPNHHPAMKNVAPVRRELGVKTIFNILGPLTNPADAPNILMGVFHADLVGIQVRVLEELGADHAVVVYGRDNLDEISLGAATLVGELKNGVVSEYEIHPEDFGLTMRSTRALQVKTPEESRQMLLGVLDNHEGAARDVVLMNAGMALYAANVVDSMEQGIALARQALDSGGARNKLDQFVRLSCELAKVL